jgi:hypothetical protein
MDDVVSAPMHARAVGRPSSLSAAPAAAAAAARARCAMTSPTPNAVQSHFDDVTRSCVAALDMPPATVLSILGSCDDALPCRHPSKLHLLPSANGCDRQRAT